MSGASPPGGLVPTRAQLRALLTAFRRGYHEADLDREPDDTLIALLEEPFESTGVAHERLRDLESHLRAQGSRRAVFLSIYVEMTREAREAIDTGAFADPEWMRDYLVTFADYYRRAFLAFERGDFEQVPLPWRIAFTTAVRGDALIAQDAFLGVNAHINYDLAFTLRDIGISPDRPQKYADHRAINDVLGRLVNIQQELLAERYAPGIDRLDDSLGSLDESFTLFSLTEGREHAWRLATVLVDSRLSPLQSYARWLLHTTATGGALFILSPNVDSALLGTLRRVESDDLDVEDVIDQFRARSQNRT